MTDKSTEQLAKDIITVMNAMKAAPPMEISADARLRAAYEEVLKVKAGLTFEEFKAELDAEEIKRSEYFMRLPEALEKGVFFEANFFQDKERSFEMLSKSKYVLFPNKAWVDIIGSNDYAQALDPITKFDLALDGRLGSMGGCLLITDAFMPPHLKDTTSAAAGKVVFVLRETE